MSTECENQHEGLLREGAFVTEQVTCSWVAGKYTGSAERSSFVHQTTEMADVDRTLAVIWLNILSLHVGKPRLREIK